VSICDRQYERKPLDYPCWIEIDGRTSLIPCHIRDFSEGGAYIAVRNVSAIPDKFRLRFSVTTQTSRECNVRCRLADGVGVEFGSRWEMAASLEKGN
jgi:hypothetical protein